MNYFAHGRPFVADPYILAGTAVPDWLNVVDRSIRVRAKNAAQWIDAPEPEIAGLARGIVQHHRDDEWFHRSRAFAELSLELTVKLREVAPSDRGFRPSFLGHILVEILLDAWLVEHDPQVLHIYYEALNSVDPAKVERAVNRMSPRATDKISLFLPRFCQERFLWDYVSNGKLTVRVNQVLHRVGLTPLPREWLAILPSARDAVYRRAEELLTAPDSASPQARPPVVDLPANAGSM